MIIYDDKHRLYRYNARELRDFDLEFLYNLYFSLEEEKCGIITAGGIVGCDNISKTPEENFRMGKKQYEMAAKHGDIFGFIHAHFAKGFHSPEPSIRDFKFVKKFPHLEFNILIILWTGQFLFWNKDGVFERKSIAPSSWHQIELKRFEQVAMSVI